MSQRLSRKEIKRDEFMESMGEAIDYVRSQAGDEFALLSTNEPTMNYYLRPDIYRGEYSPELEKEAA